MRLRSPAVLAAAGVSAVVVLALLGPGSLSPAASPLSAGHHGNHAHVMRPPVAAWTPSVAAQQAPKPKVRSGGRAIAHAAGGRILRAPGLLAKAPTAAIHGIGIKGWEPTLGLTSDGHIFYTAFDTNTKVEIVRSTDEAKSWEVVSPKINDRNTHFSFDPYIWVDPWTDRIFTADLGPLTCSMLSYSDDQGESWTTNPVACGQPVNDHQTLFGGPPVVSPTVGYENIVYYCWNDFGTSSCSKSLDGGLTFHRTGSPAFVGPDPSSDDGVQPPSADDPIPGCGGLHGHGYVGHDGTVYLPRGYCGQPWLGISKDEGRTWTTVQVARNGADQHEAGVASDAKGNIYYTWINRDRMPYLAISRDGGETWGEPMMIGYPGINEANIPGIDVGGTGKVAIVYLATKNGPGRPWPENDCAVEVLPCEHDSVYPEDTSWNGYITMSANALDKNPVFYTASINHPSEPLDMRACGPGRCSPIGDFVDIVIGPDGTPWAALVQNCGIAVCPHGLASTAESIVGRLVGGPKLR